MAKSSSNRKLKERLINGGLKSDLAAGGTLRHGVVVCWVEKTHLEISCKMIALWADFALSTGDLRSVDFSTFSQLRSTIDSSVSYHACFPNPASIKPEWRKSLRNQPKPHHQLKAKLTIDGKDAPIQHFDWILMWRRKHVWVLWQCADLCWYDCSCYIW